VDCKVSPVLPVLQVREATLVRAARVDKLARLDQLDVVAWQAVVLKRELPAPKAENA
jgi:hypothetical protein